MGTETFWWGTASSPLQSEGAAPASDWAEWESEGRVPPSGDGNGFRTRYADDLRLIAAHGFSHHRLAVDWARIEPDDGRRDLDEVERVREVLSCGGDAGLAIVLCLHHVTLPRWFTDDLHGFRDEKLGRYRWSAHVDFCAEAFGDLVAGWQPMEVPARYALDAFLLGRLPPGRSDPVEFPGVLATVHRASTDAARLLRGGAGPVLTSHWLAPLRPSSPEADEVIWESWADPEIVEPFDMLGVTVNPPVRVEIGDDEEGPPFTLAADPGPPPADQVTDAVAEVIGRVAGMYSDKPVVVRGSELAFTGDDDERRVEHLRAILDGIDRAVDAGADVRGYFQWTAIDGYELDGGFEVKRGLFDRDRQPRPTLDVLRARMA